MALFTGGGQGNQGINFGGTSTLQPMNIQQEFQAWNAMPDSPEKYAKAKELEGKLPREGWEGTYFAGVNSYISKNKFAAQQFLASGAPAAEALIETYNKGGQLDPVMQDAFKAYSNYFKEGQADPGKFNTDIARQASQQWARDTSPSGLMTTLSDFADWYVPSFLAVTGGMALSEIGAGMGAGEAAGGGTAAETAAEVGTTVGTTEGGLTAEQMGQAAVGGGGLMGGGGGGGGSVPATTGNVPNQLSNSQIQSLQGNQSAFQAYQQAGMIPQGVTMNPNGSISGISGLGSFLGSPTGQGLLNLGAGYLQGEQSQQAANQYAQAQIEAARIAAEAARFKPVGVTTRFGQSNFQFDPQGNLTSAGYTVSPEVKAQQDALMGAIMGNQRQGMLPVQPMIAGARANGGPVAGGQTYLVGERGPEPYVSPYGSMMVGQNGPQLFNAPANGTIVPSEYRPVLGGGNVGPGGTVLPPQFRPQNNITNPKDSAVNPAPVGGLLGQAVGAQQTTAPMTQGAQSLFNLGQGYLASSPQEQANLYMQQQQALLAPSRERELAQLQNQMYQQGRTGLGVGATSTMGAANPELEAFYNAQRQQDLALAAQATQGGQQYAQFGAGMLGTGGELLRGMYGTQTAAYQPYQTALGLTGQLEGLGQNAMDIGMALGSSGATAGANVGEALQYGYGTGNQAQYRANQYSPWASLLQGAAAWR